MKKFILLLLLLNTTAILYAQRINEYGKKMVKELEILDWEHDKILFEYNDQNRLTGMTVYKDWEYEKHPKEDKVHIPKFELYAEYRLQGNTMYCKRYDEEYSEPLYDFKFDEWGHILGFKANYLDEDEPEGYRVISWDYTYPYDELAKRHMLSEEDSNILRGTYSEIREGENIDPDHKNDTNISTEWILYFSNCGYSVDYYFKITEWVDCINDYFHKGVYDNQFTYEYDDRGNLVELSEFEKMIFSNVSTWDTTIKFKYVED